MRCPTCHADSFEDSLFCTACGARLESRCPACGGSNPLGARFCRKCGIALETPAAEDAPWSLADDGGERRHLTVMFCDLVESVPLGERLDPEELHAVVHAYQESCAQVI